MRRCGSSLRRRSCRLIRPDNPRLTSRCKGQNSKRYEAKARGFRSVVEREIIHRERTSISNDADLFDRRRIARREKCWNAAEIQNTGTTYERRPGVEIELSIARTREVSASETFWTADK